MAYGFNNDKSKAEVYSKDDFLILEGTIENVPANGKKSTSISSIEGISDDKYTILTAMQRVENRWDWGASVAMVLSQNRIDIVVSNVSSSPKDMKYRVIFLKTA